MIQDTSKSTREALHEHIDDASGRVKAASAKAVGRAKAKFNTAADRTGDALHQAADVAARGAHQATDKADDLRERGADLASGARDRMDRAVNAVGEFVCQRPAASIGIALAAGWLLWRAVGVRRRKSWS